MGFIPPPHLANGAQPSYAETYSHILAEFRSSPLVSASSVLILVAADVDALCAARMLSNLFRQDDVIHRIVPIPGFRELEAAREDIIENVEVHTLILLNLGGMVDLSTDSWFGNANPRLTIHLVDSLRPIHLGNYFLADRVIVWDDGQAKNLQEVGRSFELITFEPDYESDPDASDLDSEDGEEVERSEVDDDEYGEKDVISGKRRPLGRSDSKAVKKRRTSREQTRRMTRDEYESHQQRVSAYFGGGSCHGQSASGTMYILATVLERVDNDLLWFAILGLTYQYTTSRISREFYDTYQSIYYDEVSRLNPPPPNGAHTSLNPDDTSVRASDELRFMLFRHWTLYDAMYHSGYVASKLGIWKERGRKRLTGLLAKMGFSLLQTQQPYSHMDMDLKKDLLHKLNDVAPEYGLVELSYPSFMRCYGYRSQPLSAADAIEGISALLDIASGVRIEIEIEGARNGGEWFGGGRVWEATAGREVNKRKRDDEQHRQDRVAAGSSRGEPTAAEVAGGVTDTAERRPESHWWIKNFWTAFDALDDIGQLRDALNLSMSLHRAIIRQGTSIIDKQDIKTMRNYRIVILSQGPDLAIFVHPSVLSRLALWLVDALRDRVPGGTIGTRTKRKSLPFVVACLNESAGTYMVVGVMAALDFGDVRKNEFGAAFMGARQICNIQMQYTSFDASVLEIPEKDLKIFLDVLCEGSEEL
ncbi:CDC45-like protein [Lyophyllum atratum]|nr:CDC45-like protein [Lyophyllum atratum]